MWHEGSLKVKDSIFHYWVKSFDDGSVFGIDEGRISKLMLKRDSKIVCNYDRGWDVEPIDEEPQITLAILMKKYN